MSEDLIRLEGVVRRGTVLALAGVTLRVRRGEFVALLGPSGRGETTLLRTIAGFVEPSEGKVWIDDHAAAARIATGDKVTMHWPVSDGQVLVS